MQSSVGDQKKPVTMIQRKGTVMQRDKRRAAGLRDPILQGREHPIAQSEIKRALRLVKKKQLCIRDQHSCKDAQLLLSLA